MAKDRRGYVKVCGCGKTFTKEQWKTLRLVGIQHQPADKHGPEEKLELRDCACKSTIAIKLPVE